MEILMDGVGWLHVLVQLGGLGVAVVYLGRTKWAWVLVSGFATGAAVSLFFRVGAIAARSGSLSYEVVGPLYAVASLAGLCGDVAVIAGVAGLLGGLPRDQA
jgi:hypothetical protein